MNDVEYAELEAQWIPLLNKFARWPIAGMSREDIMQEMRIILLKSRRRFDKSNNTKFITFFYTACLNKMLKLLRDNGMGAEPRQKWVPPYQTFPLCDGEHRGGECGSGWCTGYEFKQVEVETEGLSDLDLLNLFGNMSDDAKWLIGLITREPVLCNAQGKNSRWGKSMATQAMGHKRFKRGMNELKVILKGGLS